MRKRPWSPRGKETEKHTDDSLTPQLFPSLLLIIDRRLRGHPRPRIGFCRISSSRARTGRTRVSAVFAHSDIRLPPSQRQRFLPLLEGTKGSRCLRVSHRSIVELTEPDPTECSKQEVNMSNVRIGPRGPSTGPLQRKSQLKVVDWKPPFGQFHH